MGSPPAATTTVNLPWPVPAAAAHCLGSENVRSASRKATKRPRRNDRRNMPGFGVVECLVLMKDLMKRGGRLVWLFSLFSICAAQNATRITLSPFAAPGPARPSLAPAAAKPTPAPQLLTRSPTRVPTVKPTVSPKPTTSAAPSLRPTVSRAPTTPPTQAPTVRPTFREISTVRGTFRQDFIVPPDPIDNDIFLNANETEQFKQLLVNYTEIVFPNAIPGEIDTVCELDPQTSEPDPTDSAKQITVLDYECVLTSPTFVVTAYPDKFLTMINANIPAFLSALQAAGVSVTSIGPVRPRQIQTNSPTTSPMPSAIPSNIPTQSPRPTGAPSDVPTGLPSTSPSLPRSTPHPTKKKSEKASPDLKVGVIAGIVVSAGFALLVCLYLYYLFWSQQKSRRAQFSTTLPTNGSQFGPPWGQDQEQSAAGDREDETDRNVMLSPTESLMSGKSLVSSGDQEIEPESGDEADGTGKLKDEFDQYKDPNVEQLRVDVEDNLTGFEGIMSQAVTNALMGDEDANVETQELLWGCDPSPSGAEIEASALHEVFDWLKRNDNADTERKRAFMQEILNKMVTSVRYGVLGANDAARTIHESAALLGLQLENKLPDSTLIISGMQKTTTAEDMVNALKEFGDISEAAVASGRRGFGLVRFQRNGAIERAMQRYRSAEIVILDVSIQMKVISMENTLVEQ